MRRPVRLSSPIVMLIRSCQSRNIAWSWFSGMVPRAGGRAQSGSTHMSVTYIPVSLPPPVYWGHSAHKSTLARISLRSHGVHPRQSIIYIVLPSSLVGRRLQGGLLAANLPRSPWPLLDLPEPALGFLGPDPLVLGIDILVEARDQHLRQMSSRPREKLHRLQFSSSI